MASNVIFNAVSYSIPAEGDTGWGPDLTAYLISIASNAFQKTGGAFTLTSEANFGNSFGVSSLYLKSRAANPSSTGVVRLGSTQSVSWRNNANTADLALTTDASDNLLYNSKTVLFSGLGLIVNADVSNSAAIAYSKLNLATSIVNADIAVGAAIAYSKLNLATSIVNADISSSAAIAYSKLSLATSILNSDIATGAAIAYSKLAALTVSRALVSDASGVVSASSVTSTELGYVSGVTSAIQSQLGTKVTNPMTTGGDIIYGGGSGAPTRLANGSAGQVLTSAGGTSAPTWSNRYKTVGAKIVAAGTVSDENFNWINGNASVATSTFTITLVSGFFASISSVQVSIIGDVTTGFLGTSSVVSASTSTIVVSFSTVGAGNIARDFYITVVGT